MGFLIFVFSCLCAFFGGVIFHDLHNIRTVRYVFSSGKVEKRARFAVISDLHGRRHGQNNSKLIRKIERLHPDFVLMAGDIMTAKDIGYSVAGSVDTACTLIRALSRKFPVYFAIGNHEERIKWRPKGFSFTYEDMLSRFRQAGAVILSNDNVLLEEYGIRIYGLNLPEIYYKKRGTLSVKKLRHMLGRTNREYFNLLLAHNPEYLEAYGKWGADLTFSGHYHGGIMQLPGLGGVVNPRFELFPKFTGGLYHEGGKAQVVCRGIGCHTLPVRVFNPVELVCMDVRPDMAKRNNMRGSAE